MENIETIISFVIVVVTAIGSLVSLVVKIRNAKIEVFIREKIKEAEASGKTGTEKLQYVVEKVKERFTSLGIIKDSSSLVDLINKIVADYNDFKTNK